MRTVQRSALCRFRRELSQSSFRTRQLFQRVFSCKLWLRYSRERALQSLPALREPRSPRWARSGPRWTRRTRPPRPTSGRSGPGLVGAGGLGVRVSKIGKILQNFANFWQARSRLYQNEILQENMRLTAFFTLYKICILLHRYNLKFFAKNRFEKLRISQKF